MNILELYKEELEQMSLSNRERHFSNIKHDGSFVIDRNGNRMLNLSGNDYIGISARNDFREIWFNEIQRKNTLLSSCSSRLLTGNSEEYEELEALMSQLFARSVLLFNSGYHMNLAVLPALVHSKSLIIADKLVHASIIDGIKLSRAKFERFNHNDLNHLEKIIIKNKDNFNDIIIVVESIYSMDGDIADLRALVELKKKYPIIRLYVDEAHAIGARGHKGLGLAEETDTMNDIDLLLGTFGKAIASMGGYIVCDEITRRYLIQKARPLIFSTALPPHIMTFNRIVFEHLDELKNRRDLLKEKSIYLKKELANIGLESLSQSNIIPVIVGGDRSAVDLSLFLQREGFYLLPIRPPTVPNSSSRIRISLTSESENLDKLFESIKFYFENYRQAIL